MQLNLTSPYYLIELIIEALKYYDLGEFKKIIKIIKSDDNYLVAFSTNEGEYVIKIYKRYLERPDLINSLESIKDLLNLEISFIPICLTREGDAFLKLNSDGFNELITVDKYISETYKYDPNNKKMIQSSAKLLADLHNKTMKLSESKNDFNLIFEDFSEFDTFFGTNKSEINLFKQFSASSILDKSQITCSLSSKLFTLFLEIEITLNPSVLNFKTKAFPIPLLPPVIIATLFIFEICNLF
mgnify:CR=1 FL=1